MNTITFQSVGEPSTSAAFSIGQVGQTPNGNVYRYVQASGALAKGSACVPVAPTTANGCSSSADVLGRIVFITNSGASWTAGAFVGGYVYINAGTGIGQQGYIIDNTATTLQLSPGSALGTALSVADSNITITQPFTVSKSAITSKLQNAMGLSQAVWTDTQYGWILMNGIGQALVGTSTLVVGANFVTGDGSVTGSVIVGTTAKGPFDEQSLGRCLVANTANNTLTEVYATIGLA